MTTIGYAATILEQVAQATDAVAYVATMLAAWGALHWLYHQDEVAMAVARRIRRMKK